MEVGSVTEAEETPTLISNVEVLELLKKNLSQRETTLQQNPQSHNAKRWKQRDWLERKVIEYLQTTPCTKLDPSRRQELQSILKNRKRKAVNAEKEISATPNVTPSLLLPTPPHPPAPPLPDQTKSLASVAASVSGVAADRCESKEGAQPDRTESSQQQSKAQSVAAAETAGEKQQQQIKAASTAAADLSGFGLTEAEALQIINFMPTEAVELHLMIEDLNSRLTQKQQDGLLETISNFTRKEDENNPRGVNDDDDGGEGGMDYEVVVEDSEDMAGAVAPSNKRQNDASHVTNGF